MPGTCLECKQPLIMIDNRGRHLQGCVTCNEWRDSAGNAVKLSVEGCAACAAAVTDDAFNARGASLADSRRKN